MYPYAVLLSFCSVCIKQTFASLLPCLGGIPKASRLFCERSSISSLFNCEILWPSLILHPNGRNLKLQGNVTHHVPGEGCCSTFLIKSGCGTAGPFTHWTRLRTAPETSSVTWAAPVELLTRCAAAGTPGALSWGRVYLWVGVVAVCGCLHNTVDWHVFLPWSLFFSLQLPHCRTQLPAKFFSSSRALFF